MAAVDRTDSTLVIGLGRFGSAVAANYEIGRASCRERV